MLRPPTLVLLTLGASSLLYRSWFDPPEEDAQDTKIYIKETLIDLLALGAGMCVTEWLHRHLRPLSYALLLPPFLIIVATLLLICKLKLDNVKQSINVVS